VDLFFVLSGWLLGHQLLRELKRTGTIEVRRFWTRRWMRTLPAYFVVLGLTYAWQVAKGNYYLDPTYLFFGQTYLSRMPYFGVSWSLCVEEHFYLVIAPLLLFARAQWRSGLLVLLLLPVLFRGLDWYRPVEANRTIEETHVRWDQCGAGVLLAYAEVFCPRVWPVLVRAAPALALLSLGAAGFNMATRVNASWGVGDLGIPAWAAVFTALVLLANSGVFWQSSVSFLPTRFLADRAYALYLLHGEAIAVVKRLGFLSFPVALLLTWVVSLLLAEALYRAVERPFLRLRERFAWSQSRAVKSPGEQKLVDGVVVTLPRNSGAVCLPSPVGTAASSASCSPGSASELSHQ
jgi:peptidoglycan/LPS O-acetylase OafA/YrhL